MSRRRLHPPWIPGFRAMVAFLLLLTSVFGFYYLLGRSTEFHRVEAPAVKAK
jgi:hypothetical protein